MPFGTITATVIRPAGRDRDGDPTGSPTEHDVDGCMLAPGNTTEVTTQADTVVADATLYAPAGADIMATDRLRADGTTYDIVGRPQRWLGDGVVVLLRVVTG